MKIDQVSCGFIREPLSKPFGFKGGYLSELWQSVVTFTDSDGKFFSGLGTQSVLWSDSKVFTSESEATGNSMMFLTTSYGAKLAKDITWDTPIDLLDKLIPDVYDYAKLITKNSDLRLTFVLNALVPVDNAAWLLYAEKEVGNCQDGENVFDKMLPNEFHESLKGRQDKLAAVPLISYNVTQDEILEMLDEGCFFLKVKIGSDPDGDGDLDKMLKWDMQRLSDIHNAVKNSNTPYTDSGRIPYYLDANGRYDSKERLMRFLDHAKEIGALERIMLLEEPFPEEMEIDVSDIPVRVVADESAHSDVDAEKRIKLGYGAIALKPIAKTMSMSLKIAKFAAENNIPCFCADLTVNPILIEWNKNFAARLTALPGMKIGVLESNGHQNYKNWDKMMSERSFPSSEWGCFKDGIFNLDKDFYLKSGGIFNN